MKRIILIITISVFFMVSCKSGQKKPDPQQGTESLKQFELVEAWSTDTVLLVPESVIYDQKRDILYVSNLNYEPRKKDGNGFISKLGTDGKIIELRWIEGLSSPKGLAIVGDSLFAADVDELVVMDINKGQIVKRLTIEGVKMINDVTSDPGGNLYISDSDANKIYIYSKGILSEWLSEGLNGPNGLLVDGERLLLASMGSMDFTSIDMKTKEKIIISGGINRGDGIAPAGIPGHFFVSDWTGEIFLVYPDHSKVSLLKTSDKNINTADICYLPGKKMLLIPTFFKQSIIAFSVKDK